MTTLYDIPVNTLAGEAVTLAPYRGQVLLIVNTASQCGFTPQYAELEALYKKYKDQGFAVLGFPCNQFGGQEPGSDAEIAAFCDKRYGVSFPMFAKIDVNGAQEHPLYTLLKQSAPGVLGTEGIKWNFTKFLIDREGKVIGRYAPMTSPGSLEPQVQGAL